MKFETGRELTTREREVLIAMIELFIDGGKPTYLEQFTTYDEDSPDFVPVEQIFFG